MHRRISKTSWILALGAAIVGIPFAATQGTRPAPTSREVVNSAPSPGGSLAITVQIATIRPVPYDYELLQNYPNPFNAGTLIQFTMRGTSHWKMTIYNIIGQSVREFSGYDETGSVRIDWNGTGQNGSALASGVYFYRVHAGPWSATKKLMIIK